jgi:hypothetical protein
MLPRAVLLLLSTLSLLPAAAAAKTVEVTTCGQTVRGRAILVADLDCSSHPGHALVLDGKLEMHGFTLTGNTTDVSGPSTVDCTGKCRIRIVGPGTIVGGSTAVSGLTVSISHEVTIRDALEWGVTGAKVGLSECFVTTNGAALPVGPAGGGGISGGKVKARRSTISDNASYGVNANRRATLNRSTALGNAFADVRSFDKPLLTDATCQISRRANTIESWNVCLGE